MQQGAASTASGFRAAFDYKNLNSQLKDVGKLSLPTLGEVEQAIKNCHVSSLDLKNQFFSIELDAPSRNATNFYWGNQILMHYRLPMGLASSPYIASCAMQFTFSDAMLLKFKEENDLMDFPFTKFAQFSKYYLDDVIVFTSKKPKSCKYDSKQLHFIALEAIVFALQHQGWIASLQKANFLSDKL